MPGGGGGGGEGGGGYSIKCKWSYGTCSLHNAGWCFIFLASSMNISQRVSKLLSGHNFQGNKSVKT